jgi:hypothetical protein
MFYSNAYLSSINKSPFNSQRPRGVPVVSRSSSSRCQNVKESIFEVLSYSTVRSATIKSYKVGIIYRLAQLLLLFYIVGWELILQKGYQATETVSYVNKKIFTIKIIIILSKLKTKINQDRWWLLKWRARALCLSIRNETSRWTEVIRFTMKKFTRWTPM